MGTDLKQRAMAQPAQNQPQTLGAQVQSMEKQFALAMPKGMEATQLVRDALTCLRQTPQLADCDSASVLGSLMTCAQLGLRPGVLGQAYLLPLWNGRNRRREAQLILGYQGLVELIYRSDQVNMISARVVYSNDEFVYEYGLEEDKLIHRPPTSGPRGDAVAYYAIARMKGGGYAMTDVMSRADMEKHRDQYAMAKKKDGTVVGPWVTQFDEMAKKTMVRQLAKMLPKSPEVQRAITHDGAVRVDYTAAGIDSQPAYIDSVSDDAPAVEQAPDDVPAPVDRDSLEAALLVALDQAGVKDVDKYLSEQFGTAVGGLGDLTPDELQSTFTMLAGGK